MVSELALRAKKIAVKGLPESEAKVYVALLELGRGLVSQISRRSGVPRTYVYTVLDTLSEKGLVRITGKEPKEEYAAEPPEKLVAYIERLAKESADALSAVQKELPELNALVRAENRPKIKFYEGAQGLREVYEDTLTSTETIHAYATVEDMHATLKDYFPRYYERRAENGIGIRVIMPDTPLSRERAMHNASEKRESVLVPQDEYRFSPEINIYDNKVMIASWREKLGVIIESAEIADAMKKIFKLSWIGAQTLQK